jgi:hypothetical protein
MSEISSLFTSYRRRGLVVDSNILLLYFVGLCDPKLISGFKRTSQFVVEDFDLLLRVFGFFEKIVTTPNILTEVNNLAGQLHYKAARLWRAQFQQQVKDLIEMFVPSAHASSTPAFLGIGLTDAGIATVSKDQFLVLTDDLKLFLALQSAGVDAVNFNHFRTANWDW